MFLLSLFIWLLFPVMSGVYGHLCLDLNALSIRTAKMMTKPLTNICTWYCAPKSDIPLLSAAIMRQPPNVPHIEPTPPAIAVPPRITPEMLSSAKSLPASGRPELNNAARIESRNEGEQPIHRISGDLDQADVDASYPGCFNIAANASHKESEFCLIEKKP